MKKTSKKVGLGTLSLLLTIMGLLFSLSFGNQPCYGDSILNFIGLKSWSGKNELGTHYTIYYSLIFFIPSMFMAYKYKNDFGAKIGGVIALLASVTPLTIIILVLFDLVRNCI